MEKTPAAAETRHTLAKLRRTVYDKCIPINATFEITLRCNIRCHHCYNFDRNEPYPISRVRTELSAGDTCRIIDELADAGCLYLNFTGGEALMHPHLPDFIRHARNRHMLVKVKTNGILLSLQRATALAEAGAHAVDISLYGASENTYAAFTGIPNSYRRVMEGIAAARQAGLRVRLGIPILKTTVHELDRMMEFAHRNELTFVADPHITARYDGTRSSTDERVDPETLERLYRKPLQPWVRGPNSTAAQAPQCSCGRSTCGISAYGDLYPCIGAPLLVGNLRARRFSDLWNHSPVLNWIRGLQLDDFSVCKPCPHRVYCRRSSGAIYSNTGDYTGPEEWTCMEAEILHRLHDEGIVGPKAHISPEGAVQRHSIDQY